MLPSFYLLRRQQEKDVSSGSKSTWIYETEETMIGEG